MKKLLVILAGGLLSCATAAIAAPAPQHGNHDRDHHGQQDRHDNHDRHGDHDRRDDRSRHDRNARRYVVVHDRGRHEGWYRRGGYVPVEYRSSRYVVADWRGHRLRQPPRGYHWVRSDDGQFLLVAITSGLIADILLSH